MNISYFNCELCGVQLMHADNSNKTKFPVTRRFQDNNETKKLLTVRCAECDGIPYWLQEGNPSRAHLFNADGVTILRDLNREYNFWSYGIGHLLELYTSERDKDSLLYFRNTPFEIGFLVDEEVNLIILTHRFTDDDWMVTPYIWHAYKAFAHDIPVTNPVEENHRKFTLAIIDDKGGKYLVIRKGLMSLEFANALHATINKQIERGLPTSIDDYRSRVKNLYELLMDDNLDSKIQSKTLLVNA